MPGPDDPTAGAVPPVQNYEPARRHVGVGPDADGDGLSDDFESNVFGSDPTAKDPDGDGLNDWAEWWLDTKPNDADSDRDGYLDGEDLAFGDPLAKDPGGASRTELRERARRQFDAEGTDKDKDWLRDHVEAGEGTDAGDPDSDGDGLADGVEVQLRNSGVTTSQDSTPDDTTDLDAAREALGTRRWEAAQNQGSSSSSLDEPDDSLDSTFGDGGYVPFFEQPAIDEPTYDDGGYEEPSYSEASYDDTAIADAGETSDVTFDA